MKKSIIKLAVLLLNYAKPNCENCKHYWCHPDCVCVWIGFTLSYDNDACTDRYEEDRP